MDRNSLLNDTETAHRYGLDGRQAQIWTAMPGIVESVDLDAMTIEVQLAIQGITTNADGTESHVNLPLLVDVPICFPSAGGFTLTLPIAAGDEVLVMIASRCIDAWWQNGGVGVPMEARMHDLSDGFAVPGPRSQPRVVPAISSVNAQLRSDAGDVYVEITPSGKINLVAPAGVKITGDLEVTGDVAATNVNATVGVMAGVIPLTTHKHTGVTPGPGTTGVPIP